MAKLLLTLAILSTLLVGGYCAACSTGPWWAKIDSEVATIDFANAAKLKQPEDSQFKTKWDAMKAAEPAVITAALIPKYCTSFFPVDATKKTCCNANSEMLINGFIRNLVKQNVGEKKQDKCQVNVQKVKKAQGDCMKEWLKSLKTSAVAGTGNATVSVSISMGSMGSMNSGGFASGHTRTSKMEQLEKQKKATEDVVKFQGLAALAEIVRTGSQLMRGALCVICQDPAAPVADLWNSGSGQPIINEAALTSVRDAIKKAFLSINELAQTCVDMATNAVNEFELMTKTTCPAARDALKGLSDAVKPCKDAAECETKSKAAVTTPYNIGGVTEATGDATAPLRVLQTTYQVDATKGAKSQPDAAEDDSLDVGGGYTASSATTSYNTAQTEQTTAGGAVNYSDYQAELAAEQGAGSSILGALLMVLVTLFFL